MLFEGSFAGFLTKLVAVVAGGTFFTTEGVESIFGVGDVTTAVPVGVGGVAFLAIVASRLLSQWRSDRTYEGTLRAMENRAKDAENREARLRWDNNQLITWAYDNHWDGKLKPMPPEYLPHPPAFPQE